MLELDRNGTGCTSVGPGHRRQNQRDLQEATGPDEVGGKGRAQRIAPPGSAGDVVAPFVDQSVIQHADYGCLRRQRLQNRLHRYGPELFQIHTLTLEQTIAARPVLELMPGGAE